MKEKKINLRKQSKSGLARFTQRPLPDEREVSDFERSVSKEIREEEINDNLSEIYQDKKGNLVDVTSKSFKKNKSWLLLILKNLLFILVLAVGIYLAYYYYNNQYLSVSEAKIEIKAPDIIKAGKEFEYTIVYHNPSTVSLENIGLELRFPESFIMSDSSIEPELANYWNLENLLPNQTKQLKISGKLYNRTNSANPINARLSYMPANFSSQFSKEASANTLIEGLGFNVVTDYFSTALVSQEAEINISFKDFFDNYLSEIIIEFIFPDNFSFQDFSLIDNENSEEEFEVIIEEVTKNTWFLSQLPPEADRLDFNLIFKVLEKLEDEEKVSIILYHQDESENKRKIYEETIQLEVMQSDLSLSLEINENRSDQSINFGDKLDYVLSYHNKGQATLNDVVLMLVVEGDMIDWSSLEGENRGRLLDSVIVYSKDELPDLAELRPNEKGEINFSLLVKKNQGQDFSSNLEINSWAQFSFGSSDEELKRNEDNRSNLILKLINSDLNLNEEIRYFDDNNIPVGSGPLPPEVDKETSVRVYWTISNNLHELRDLEISLSLPKYVNWSSRLQSNIGDLSYNENENKVVWKIDNLALSIHRADAEFNLSFTPTEDDLDKILIISPGVNVFAKDLVTGGEIKFKTAPKTSRLEDDEIASWTNTGRVQ